MLNRDEMTRRAIGAETNWDIIIIGGGATGVGCAVDASSRGFSVLLLEQDDFGKGTSSRSTKLIHGGVRYLRQGNFSLVFDSLRERGNLLQNAPHVVRKLRFVVPCFSNFEKLLYFAGLKIYSLLARQWSFGETKILSRNETIQQLPNIETRGLRGGVSYSDGQFDDTRLLINLVATAAEHGAVLINYARVNEFTRNTAGKIDGVKFRDEETGKEPTVSAKIVINATGAFCDAVRKMSSGSSSHLIKPSQGIHLVLERKFLPTENAIMIPETTDGRVLFAIPWNEHVLVGTTDTPLNETSLEPRALDNEIDFVLETLSRYLAIAPTRSDILSVFAGIRPLLQNSVSENTASLSRDHFIEIDSSNLITVTGGKWTSYRKMAEDTIDRAVSIGKLPARKCVTGKLKIHGANISGQEAPRFSVYGSDAAEIEASINDKPSLDTQIHPRLAYTFAEIAFAIRNEMAITLEDVLARRSRALFLDASAAIECAPRVVEFMAMMLERDALWAEKQLERFRLVARGYQAKTEKLRA